MLRCMFCNSKRVMKFIDGFGERRVFCKVCGRSFLENTYLKVKSQTTLLKFQPAVYDHFTVKMG